MCFWPHAPQPAIVRGTLATSFWGWTPSPAMSYRPKHVIQGAAKPWCQVQSHWSKWCEWWNFKDRDLFRKSQGMKKWQHWELGLGGNDTFSPIPLAGGPWWVAFQCPFKSWWSCLLDQPKLGSSLLSIICRIVEVPTFFLPRLRVRVRQNALGAPQFTGVYVSPRHRPCSNFQNYQALAFESVVKKGPLRFEDCPYPILAHFCNT